MLNRSRLCRQTGKKFFRRHSKYRHDQKMPERRNSLLLLPKQSSEPSSISAVVQITAELFQEVSRAAFQKPFTKFVQANPSFRTYESFAGEKSPVAQIYFMNARTCVSFK